VRADVIGNAVHIKRHIDVVQTRRQRGTYSDSYPQRQLGHGQDASLIGMLSVCPVVRLAGAVWDADIFNIVRRCLSVRRMDRGGNLRVQAPQPLGVIPDPLLQPAMPACLVHSARERLLPRLCRIL
jgi:hypothetical protein